MLLSFSFALSPRKLPPQPLPLHPVTLCVAQTSGLTPPLTYGPSMVHALMDAGTAPRVPPADVAQW